MKQLDAMSSFVRAPIALLIVAACNLAIPCSAVVPEPGNVYYGLALDPWGRPFQPPTEAQVIMVRRDAVNEHVLAVSEILPFPKGMTNINYILRPSLDDGIGARYSSQAARSNEVVQVFVVVGGFRYAVTNTVGCRTLSQTVPNIGGRGAVQNVTVAANDDFDADCMSDSWETVYFGNPWDCLPQDDGDFDGYTNLDEFYNGWNPIDPDSPPRELVVAIVAWDSQSVTLRWERLDGKLYSLRWSDRVDGVFSPIPGARLSGLDIIRVDLSGMDQVFIRVLAE